MNSSEIEAVFMGLPCHVRSDDPSDISWLMDFFVGAVDSGLEPKNISELQKITLTRDQASTRDARFQAGKSRQTTLAFVLDSEIQYLPSWMLGDGTLCAYSDFYDLLFTKRDDIRIFDASMPGQAGRRARGGLMRAIREPAMDHIWRSGDSILHGAGVVVEGQAVLIAGNKRSGKTSLLSAVLSQLSDSTFLANDRIALKQCGSNLIARAIPTIISLRRGSLDVVPGLAARAASLDCDHAGAPLPSGTAQERLAMTTRQFVSMLGTSVCSTAPVKSIVFPFVDPGQGTFSLRRLDRNEAREHIQNAAFARSHLGVRSEFFACRESGVFPDSETMLARLDQATENIHCFELRMGPRFYAVQEIERFVELVTA